MYANYVVNRLNGVKQEYILVSDSMSTAKTSAFSVRDGKIIDAVLGIPKTQKELIEQWFHNKAEVVKIDKSKYFYEGSFDLRMFIENLV